MKRYLKQKPKWALGERHLSMIGDGRREVKIGLWPRNRAAKKLVFEISILPK